MWYNFSKDLDTFQLKLIPEIKDEFLSFCLDEIFYSSEKDSVDLLKNKLNKNIFEEVKLREIDEIFLLFILNYFQEKTLAFTDKNLLNFFSNPASSPNHVLLMANSHSYATVKKAAQILDLSHPQEISLWKDYLADYQILFSDKYFTSPEFTIFLEIKKNLIRANLLKTERIKTRIQEDKSEFTINLKALLKTDLIIKKPIKYKNLIAYLFDEEMLSPLMSLQESWGHQTMFEYTALRSQTTTVWWVEKALMDYKDSFNFSEMIQYFESQIKPGFHLLGFKEQLNNYKDMISFMKKIEIKKALDLSLLKKIKSKDKTVKI